jgi:predicted flap endonuclease-1-like 5' DNA nuclease
MNTTTASQAADAASLATIPIMHLIVYAIVALLIVIAIVALIRRGGNQEHRRIAADVEADSAPPPVMAPPVAPGPPPLADEPIAAAAPFDASPASIAADLPPEPALPSEAPPQTADITQLKGLGPKLTARLAELGVTRLEQIAALTPAEAEALDAQLGSFTGRMTRDRWIEQARLLVAGDRAGYEAAFGKLGG